MATKRVDVLLCERGLCKSQEQAQALILAGEIRSREQRVDKPGTRIDVDSPLEVRVRTTPFASRAGQKLHYALETFGLDVAGRVCLDIGASNGGFTDCLLQRGARHVFPVDVGYGLLDAKLRKDPRVTLVERTNARFLTPADLAARNPISVEIDFLCIDVSFISLSKIVEPLSKLFTGIRDWVLLFKPQFEIGREHLAKGGIVRNESAVTQALAELDAFLTALGFVRRAGPESSPLTGKKSGNLEYLIHYELTSRNSV